MNNNNRYEFFNKTENYLHRHYGVLIRSEIIKNLLGAIKGKKIFDIGCGNGQISLQFLPENTITLLDISDNMLELVKRNTPTEYLALTERVNISFDDFTTDTRYDVILAIGYLAHVQSVPDTLEKIRGLLNDNGTFVLQFSNYNNLLTKLKFLASRNYNYSINKLRYKELKGILTKLGFEVEEEVQLEFTIPGMGKLSNKFLYNFSRFMYTSKLLSNLCTDYIWKIKKVKA